jgi:hypothetical protein
MRTPSTYAAWVFVAAYACAACSSDDSTDVSTDSGAADGATTDATAHDAHVLPPVNQDSGAADTGAGHDSSTGGGDDSSTGGDDSSTGNDSGGGGDDAGVDTGSPDAAGPDSAGPDAAPDAGPDTGVDAGTTDCGAPVSLHPVAAGTGPFCPFGAVDGGGSLTCAFGEHCCEPNAGTSTCASDCSGVPVPDAGSITDWQCQDSNSCPSGQVCCANGTADHDPACSYYFLHKLTGTVCATACAAGQVTVCERLGDCSGGTTCVPAKGKGAQFGVCQ